MSSFSTFLFLLASVQLSTPAFIKRDFLPVRLFGRAGCGNPKLTDDLSGCYSYCDTSVTQYNAAPIKASDTVLCDTPTCTPARANAVSVTEEFTETTGISSDPITATDSFSWSKSISSTKTYSFQLGEGDDGYIEFIPVMNKICGTIYSYS